MGKSALLWANGTVTEKEISLISGTPFDLIVAADGGARKAAQFGFFPHFVVGDLDSIDEQLRADLTNTQWVSRPSQDLNDLEKSLQFCQEKGIQNLTVIGFTGGRDDHTLSNLSVLCRYDTQFQLTLYTPTAQLFIVREHFACRGKPGQLISLVPVGAVHGITTKGLKYPLRAESLVFGQREGLSNVVETGPVEIQLQSGILLVFLLYPEIG